MKNTFYRPAEVDVNVFEKIVEKLHQDLEMLISGKVSDEEVIEYVRGIIHHAKPLPDNRDMVFWGQGDPRSMPADARVDFFYTPTYITVSFMMRALLDIPEKVTQLDGFMDTLKKGMLACTGRSFKGSGYDTIGGLLDYLSIFESIDISLFLRAYPKMCIEFTDLFYYAVSWLRSILEKGEILNEWGVSYTDRARDFLRKLDSRDNRIVFVYGTLMKGRRNHEAFLKNSRFIGKGVLEGYALYDLGSYPGIKENSDGKVKGELYEIDIVTLERLNCLEGEGILYKLKEAPILIGKDNTINAYIYEYLGDVKDNRCIPFYHQPWKGEKKMNKKDYVWYVGYGSNMLEERFMHYIKGGKFRNNGRNHKPCSDQTPPRAKMPYEIPYNMYYGNSSGSWDNGGVSFLDITTPGKAYGVAYLISREQFNHLYKEENGGRIPRPDSPWYNTIISLGQWDGIDVLTITNNRVIDKNPPSDRYLEVLAEALKECYTYLNDKEIWDYLKSY